MKLIAAYILLSLSIVSLLSGGGPPSAGDELKQFLTSDSFFEYYADVAKLLNEEDKINGVMVLALNDRPAYISLSEFWNSRATLYVNRDIKIMLDIETGNAISKNELEKIKKRAFSEGIQMRKSYFYENWGEINQMLDKAINPIIESLSQVREWFDNRNGNVEWDKVLKPLYSVEDIPKDTPLSNDSWVSLARKISLFDSHQKSKVFDVLDILKQSRIKKDQDIRSRIIYGLFGASLHAKSIEKGNRDAFERLSSEMNLEAMMDHMGLSLSERQRTRGDFRGKSFKNNSPPPTP